MVVGVQTWELQVFGCHSLKEKRSVLHPLKLQLRRSLNVSVAEVGAQDEWQRAQLACSAVGSDRRVVDETLRAADRLIEETDGLRIVDTAVSYP